MHEPEEVQPVPCREVPLSPSTSPNLYLTQPTLQESESIWNTTFAEWGDALTLPQFLEESLHVTTIPLAKDGGMVPWALVDKTLPIEQRTVLSSCEIIRKKALFADGLGGVSDSIVFGIASVFCDPALRHRGYGTRLMHEVAKMLREERAKDETVLGSILYSDIGKEFYSSFGWHAVPNNKHLQFEPRACTALRTTPLFAPDIQALCHADEQAVRNSMRARRKAGLMVLPDHDHMRWHHGKEEFVGPVVMGQKPMVKGAIIGTLGSRTWAIWTHRFYDSPSSPSSGNTLYILRFVVEGEGVLRDEKMRVLYERQVKAVLEAALQEAEEWKLTNVQLWDPSLLVRELVEGTGVEYGEVDREEHIGCLLWFGEEEVEWIGNEHYAWL